MLGLITDHYTPCWYELGWDPKTVSFIVRIHKDYLPRIACLKKDSPIILHLAKFTSDKEFELDLEKKWGFGGVFVSRGFVNDYLVIAAEVPQVKVKSDTMPCTHCRGKGRDEVMEDRDCYWCDGEGRAITYHHERTRSISASMSILTRMLNPPQLQVEASYPQLMTVDTITDIGHHGGSLGGMFSYQLVRWLSTFSKDVDLREVGDAMYDSHKKMVDKDVSQYRNLHYYARLPGGNGWLNITCPGDACGLNPYHNHHDGQRGYEYSCHNVDNAIQQLMLLCALGALHDKARKEMKV